MTAPIYRPPRDEQREQQLRARWCATLRTRMRERAMSAAQLAAVAGVTKSMVHQWHRGNHMPLHRTVVRLGEALGSDALVAISLELRTGRCLLCGAVFVAAGRGDRIWCSSQCNQAGGKRRRQGHSLETIALVRHRLESHRLAVAKFCNSCTLGEGVCRQPACELRPISPLPLAMYSRNGVPTRAGA